MAKGKTKSGFEFDIPDDVMNDMELFEALCDADAGDYSAAVPICRKILGAQKTALYDHLRTEDGRVPVDKVFTEITEIIEAVRNGKKS